MIEENSILSKNPIDPYKLGKSRKSEKTRLALQKDIVVMEWDLCKSENITITLLFGHTVDPRSLIRLGWIPLRLRLVDGKV